MLLLCFSAFVVVVASKDVASGLLLGSILRELPSEMLLKTEIGVNVNPETEVVDDPGNVDSTLVIFADASNDVALEENALDVNVPDTHPPVGDPSKLVTVAEAVEESDGTIRSVRDAMSDVIPDWYHVTSDENAKSAVDLSSGATGIVELRPKVAVVIGGNVKEFGVPDRTTEEAEDPADVIEGECEDSDITSSVKELDVAGVS